VAKEMLGKHTHIESFGVESGSFQYKSSAGRERREPTRQPSSRPDDLGHGRHDRCPTQSERGEAMACGSGTFVKQTEQQMFGADVWVAEHPSFLLRECQDAFGSLRERARFAGALNIRRHAHIVAQDSADTMDPS
jgi:hypothetical protein